MNRSSLHGESVHAMRICRSFFSSFVRADVPAYVLLDIVQALIQLVQHWSKLRAQADVISWCIEQLCNCLQLMKVRKL